MQIVGFKPKVPILLVTGFLGSGKTSLLKELLVSNAGKRRIAVIQNEFAQSSIDGEILKEVTTDFVIRELNTGSIFCACLFSQFKAVLKELSSRDDIDMVVVEATGIADPIAIAQLMEDKALSMSYYLSRILSVVDAPRFLEVLVKISGVRHQVQVADSVIVNKIDLVGEDRLTEIEAMVRQINPFANIVSCSHGAIDISKVLDGELSKPIYEQQGIKGELTKCGEGGYVSKCYKATNMVSREGLERFMESLSEDILRVKGYVTLTTGESVMVQYVPEQINITPLDGGAMSRVELVAIGFSEPDFSLLV